MIGYFYGLKLICVPGPVPESLRFGRNCAVVTPREMTDLKLMKDEVVKAFTAGHDKYLLEANP